MAGFLGAAATALTLFTAPQPAFAQVTAFKQAVAEAAARDEDIAAYYRTHGYAPIWTEATETQRARRAHLCQRSARLICTGCPSHAMTLKG